MQIERQQTPVTTDLPQLVWQAPLSPFKLCYKDCKTLPEDIDSTGCNIVNLLPLVPIEVTVAELNYAALITKHGLILQVEDC